MKRTIEEIMKTEYEKYHNNCKNPKSYCDWANDYKKRRVESLRNELEKWEAFEPNKKKIIVIHKK